MRTTDINLIKEYALKQSILYYKEFICPECNKKFFYIDEHNQWENYGVFLHTVCMHCRYIKEFNGKSFFQLTHYINPKLKL